MAATSSAKMNEDSIVLQLMARVGLEDIRPQVLFANKAIEAFSGTGLKPEVLSAIWDITDGNQKGYLVKDEILAALRLVGWAQAGSAVSLDLAHGSGPLACVDTLSNPKSSEEPNLANASGARFLPLSSDDRIKYVGIFERAGAKDGILAGEGVWSTLMKSQFERNDLFHIWKLADVKREGDLDASGFCVVMYLVQALLGGQFDAPPSTLPNWLYEQAGCSPPLMPLDTGHTQKVHMAKALMSEIQTLSSDTKLHAQHIAPAVISLVEHYFHMLDATNQGHLPTELVVSFVSSLRISIRNIADVWEEVDPSNKGYIDVLGFAKVALLLYGRYTGATIPGSKASTKAQLVQVKRENRLLRSQSMVQPDASHLHSQIEKLQMTVRSLSEEKRSLQSSLSSSSSARSQRENADGATSEVFEELWADLQTKNTTITMLRRSLETKEGLEQENEDLKTQLDRARERVQATQASADMIQQLLKEDHQQELNALERQLRDLRESPSIVPSADGDEDLQKVINEQLARDNGGLRTLVAELRDALARVEEDRQTAVEQAEERQRELQREIQNLRMTSPAGTPVESESPRRLRRGERRTSRSGGILPQLSRPSSQIPNLSIPSPTLSRQREATPADAAPPAYDEAAFDEVVS